MKPERQEKLNSESQETSISKKPYSSPALIEYGSLVEITGGGSGARALDVGTRQS